MYPIFGRYSDSYKPHYKREAWFNSEKFFEEKRYLDSYEAFLNYLRDDDLDNVHFRREKDEIKFELFQGSKTVKGQISNGKILAESVIAEFEKPAVSFMRKLMELNFTLFYNRFALKDNFIYLKFDSAIKDGHPRKLYYALKELATKADKQDDVLAESFSVLKIIKNSEISQIPEKEAKIKYKYFRKWINDALEKVSKLNEDSFSGGISYILLNTIYKIDYLITPEGTIMNEIEKASWQYFAQDNRPYVEKNREIKNILEKFLNTSEQKVIKDLTRSKPTFGILTPAPHETLIDTINKNIGNVKYHLDNNMPEIALNVTEYIVSYSLFSYALPKADVELLHIAMNIINQDYFAELGYGEVLYDLRKNSFNERKIKKEISKVIERNRNEYPLLNFNTDNLTYNSILEFARSYLNELAKLNFTK
ncbi:MAG: YbjN domain-containing protein [Ignavibacteria bacterium]|nr:YbjN domain-containing protein [Ignavibacteria bacterium]